MLVTTTLYQSSVDFMRIWTLPSSITCIALLIAYKPIVKYEKS
jgi:hypothetical protein